MILFARGPAPLAGHPGRVRPLLGHVAAVDDEHAIRLAQRLIDETLVLGQDGVVVPGALADEVLQCPHAAVRPVHGPQQPHSQGLHVLARHVGHEQPSQVHLRPRPLLLPREERREPRVICHQIGRDALQIDRVGATPVLTPR